MGGKLKDKSTFSFQIGLLALVVLAFVPIFLLTATTFVSQRKLALGVAQSNVERFVGIIKITQEQVVSNTNELLIALSQLPEIQEFDREGCSELFAKLLGSYEKYTNLGVADLEGNVICSGLELESPVNISDRKYFREAVANKKFSIGEYQVGRITYEPSINFGYPVLNENGELQSIVYAAVSLSWINDYIKTANLPENSLFMIIDNMGKVLVVHPNTEDLAGLVGKDIPYKMLYEHILSQREGAVEMMETDGVSRIYAFTGMGVNTKDPDAYIFVGIDKDFAFSFANRDFVRSIFVLSGLLLLGLILAWVSGGRLIRKRVGYLEEIQKARKKEAELNEILKLLSKILRHDILNDLTVARGNIDMYLKYGEEEVEIKSTLKDIRESMDRSISFIHKMKELEGAVSSGKELEAINIKDVLEEVKKEHAGVNINISGEGVVLADQAFYSVMDNLIKNAKTHAGVDKVDVSIGKKDNLVLIRISDKGKGIPDEVKKNLFQEGFKYGKSGHSGLGLFIVRKTIERYGGKVRVMDNKPKGTVFEITLPKVDRG